MESRTSSRRFTAIMHARQNKVVMSEGSKKRKNPGKLFNFLAYICLPLIIFGMVASFAGNATTAKMLLSSKCQSGAKAKKTKGVTEKTISIKVRHIEDEKIIPNAVVYLLYYDEKKSEVIDKSANTKNGEVVSFDVPLGEDGASYPFVILYEKGEVDKAKELIKTTTIRAFRTPPGENCKYLELTGGKIEGCSIQIWSMGK